MGVKVTNNATTTTVGAVSSTALSLTVASGTGALFPVLGGSDYFYATLVSAGGTYEVIKVTARTDDVMTIVRAQEGTLALPFPANSRFEVRVTAASITDMIAEHDQASEITFTPTGGISATNVQSAIAEVDSESAKAATLAGSGGAALIGNAPSGTVSATTVQGAINEIVSDLASSTGASLVGANDSSGGSIFTTIQGFVNYLLSSAGSSFIGFIQAGAGAVARTLQAKMREQAFTLEDFGGSTSAGNDATAFQAAMTAAAGHPIDLNGGTYTITATAGGVVIPVTGLDLRNGTLDMSACGGGINPITTAGALGSPVSVTSDVAQYATTVVVSSVSGISAGNKLILTTATDYFSSADSVKMGEWVEVLSVNGGTNTITLTEPTRYAYTVVGAAKIYKPTTVPFVRLRNVKILGGGDGLAQNGPNLYLVDEVTMDDCSASGFANRGWQYDSCRRITVRGGYCENGDDTTGLSYGHVVSGPTDVASFEDVRGRRLRHVVTGGGTSGVIGTLICDGVYGRQMTDSTVDAHPAVDYAVFRNITHYADTASNNDGDGITCQARDGLVDGLFAPICSRYPVLMQPGCSAYPTCISVKNVYARNYGSYSGSSPVGIFVDLSITGANALTLVHIDAYDVETAIASAYGIFINLSSAGANIVRIGTGRVKVTAFGLRVNVASGKVLDYLNVAGSYERTNNSAENVYFAATAAGGIADLKMIGANVKGGQYGIRGVNVTAWNVSNNSILGYGSGALLGISDASASQVAKNNYT